MSEERAHDIGTSIADVAVVGPIWGYFGERLGRAFQGKRRDGRGKLKWRDQQDVLVERI